MNNGFVAVQRDIIDHHLLQDGERLRAWIWLICKACWKPTKYDIKGRTITLERGQVCASRAQLSEAWGWSPSACERFLARLQTEQMIERQTGQGRRIITIRNYCKYQDVPDRNRTESGQQTGQQSDSNRTAKEPSNQITIKPEILEPKGSCPSGDGLKPEHICERWNDVAKALGKPTIRKLTPERRQALKARIAQNGLSDFQEVFGKITASPFLRGDTGWKGCTFDWVFKKANFQKILEGNYND